MVNFCSDNASGAAPEILRALEAANDGWAMLYGEDDWTRRLQAQVQEVFEIDPVLCTECVGFHDEEQCAVVCPVDCCLPDPGNVEGEEDLFARALRVHPDKVSSLRLSPETSRFRSKRTFAR